MFQRNRTYSLLPNLLRGLVIFVMHSPSREVQQAALTAAFKGDMSQAACSTTHSSSLFSHGGGKQMLRSGLSSNTLLSTSLGTWFLLLLRKQEKSWLLHSKLDKFSHIPAREGSLNRDSTAKCFTLSACPKHKSLPKLLHQRKQSNRKLNYIF